MATAQINTVVQHLRWAVLLQDGAGRTDGELLESFVCQRDEAAFTALVRRHGPMVLGVCRRVARNYHDAEDAFQATFLVLARKASSVTPKEMVGNWLHGVAYRTALKARSTAMKRQGREKQVTEMPEPAVAPEDRWHDLQPLIDQELDGLPDKYRLPILLCDLEGKAIKEAARQLGWPQGTLAGRLARGRELLAKRLANRGVVLSAASLVAVVSQNVASASVPTSLVITTVKAATMIAAGQATVAGVVPATVAALTEGVITSMMLTKLSKAVVAGLVVLCLCGLGIGGFQISTAQEPESKVTKTVTTTTTTITATTQAKGKQQGSELKEGKAVARIVTDYFDNLSQNQSVKNLDLFISPNSPVVGISKEGGPDIIWRKTAKELVEGEGKEQQVKMTVEGTHVEMVDDSLAVATAKCHNQYIGFHGVFTLTSEGGRWRIASAVFQSHYK